MKKYFLFSYLITNRIYFDIINQYIIFFLLIIFINACDSNNKDSTLSNKPQKYNNELEMRNKDSLTELAILKQSETITSEQARQDSIVKVEEEKVIGNIEFGMSRKVVNKLIKKFIDENKSRKYSSGHIGNFYFDPDLVLDAYYQNKLYGLLIYSTKISWEYVDTYLKDQLISIFDVINQKYGNPIIDRGIPDSYDIKSGYSVLVYKWKVGKKIIEIRASEYDLHYRVRLEIYDSEIEERVNLEKEIEKKEKTESARDIF